jgi:hypothetical protein
LHHRKPILGQCKLIHPFAGEPIGFGTHSISRFGVDFGILPKENEPLFKDIEALSTDFEVFLPLLGEI